ncbi:hypothetical protein [Halobacillus alkaliphilus]|uniref:hypothetical protein n=1 Tax=Halobacillus alkaliphilus TaxID=396056 RepID=UPI0011133FA7|nr:hypothetical protein [Halobacillus alkaliphilus]
MNRNLWKEVQHMRECGICNGWGETGYPCPKCKGTMEDQGRITDFLDDYSPYLDQKWTNLVDGDEDSSITDECIHLFICGQCGLKDVRSS